jgi:hypothetical protein
VNARWALSRWRADLGSERVDPGDRIVVDARRPDSGSSDGLNPGAFGADDHPRATDWAWFGA